MALEREPLIIPRWLPFSFRALKKQVHNHSKRPKLLLARVIDSFQKIAERLDRELSELKSW